jgi:hypothetical protein
MVKISMHRSDYKNLISGESVEQEHYDFYRAWL